MKYLDIVATVLLIIGGLNWGLHLFDVNLVSSLFTEGSLLAKAVYALVGLAAIWKIFQFRSLCCGSSCKS